MIADRVDVLNIELTYNSLEPMLQYFGVTRDGTRLVSSNPEVKVNKILKVAEISGFQVSRNR